MKSLIIEEVENGVKRISLNSGRGNPLTPDLIVDLSTTLDALSKHPPRALVLDANGSSIFSGGFALPIIADWPRPRMKSFFEEFNSIMSKLLTIRCPVVAGVGGHAIAGGFILSLAADFRIIGNNRSKFGLSEVDLGVAVPSSARVLLGWRTTMQHALTLSSSGKLMNTEEAMKCGYGMEQVDDPESRALDLAQELAKKPGDGVATTRVLAGKTIWESMKEADDRDMDAFLDTWFSPSGQAAINAMAKKLGKSK